jgi:hypothetical protein
VTFARVPAETSAASGVFDPLGGIGQRRHMEPPGGAPVEPLLNRIVLTVVDAEHGVVELASTAYVHNSRGRINGGVLGMVFQGAAEAGCPVRRQRPPHPLPRRSPGRSVRTSTTARRRRPRRVAPGGRRGRRPGARARPSPSARQLIDSSGVGFGALGVSTMMSTISAIAQIERGREIPEVARHRSASAPRGEDAVDH